MPRFCGAITIGLVTMTGQKGGKLRCDVPDDYVFMQYEILMMLASRSRVTKA
jgi:predicted protein tyrosine phosphatase